MLMIIISSLYLLMSIFLKIVNFTGLHVSLNISKSGPVNQQNNPIFGIYIKFAIEQWYSFSDLVKNWQRKRLAKTGEIGSTSYFNFTENRQFYRTSRFPQYHGIWTRKTKNNPIFGISIKFATGQRYSFSYLDKNWQRKRLAKTGQMERSYWLIGMTSS